MIYKLGTIFETVAIIVNNYYVLQLMGNFKSVKLSIILRSKQTKTKIPWAKDAEKVIDK